MLLSFLSVVFLLGAAVKGSTTAPENATAPTFSTTAPTLISSLLTTSVTSSPTTTEHSSASVVTTTTGSTTKGSITSAPNTTESATSTPSTTASTTSAPSATAPSTSAPNVTASTTSAPSATAPSTSAPNVTVSTTSAPSAAASTTSAPSATAPSTSAPNATESAPSTSAHSTTSVATTTANATSMQSTTHAEMTSTQPSAESTTTSANFTTNTPAGSPSTPPSGTTPLTSQPTSTRTTTLSTAPATGNTTASPTTTPHTSTGITMPIGTTITTGITVTTGATVTVTTMRPTEVTTNSTTAIPVLVCPAVPCPLESVCLDGTCQCLSGSFLQNGLCTPAQVFPGQLHITSLTFKEQMRDRSSAIFQGTAANISAALRDVLGKQQGYIRSDVVRLEPGSVQATVNNIYENTNATQESVDRSIQHAINTSTSGLLANAQFTTTNLCEQEPFPCERSTTTCTNTRGRPVCACRPGYISITYSNTSCRACPSGQKAVGDTCEPCPFGYAGFNCDDSALLAVVVISCVLGGILLIMVLALLIYLLWRGCPRRKSDHSSSPYSSGDTNQPWPVGITPIPRASTNWDAAASIEMTEGGSTNVLVEKKPHSNGLSGSYDLNPDGMRTFKGKNPSRYSYLVQGHENPYFLPGDEKKD